MMIIHLAAFNLFQFLWNSARRIIEKIFFLKYFLSICRRWTSQLFRGGHCPVLQFPGSLHNDAGATSSAGAFADCAGPGELCRAHLLCCLQPRLCYYLPGGEIKSFEVLCCLQPRLRYYLPRGEISDININKYLLTLVII